MIGTSYSNFTCLLYIQIYNQTLLNYNFNCQYQLYEFTMYCFSKLYKLAQTISFVLELHHVYCIEIHVYVYDYSNNWYNNFHIIHHAMNHVKNPRVTITQISYYYYYHQTKYGKYPIIGSQNQAMYHWQLVAINPLFKYGLRIGSFYK